MAFFPRYGLIGSAFRSLIRRMRGAVRIVRISAWLLGVTLLAAHGYRQALARDDSVDMSTWSAKRIAAYRSSAASDVTPDALLRIPRLRLNVPVFAGTSERNLNRGAGFIEGTAHSGAAGNVGIAAHRDGFFRALKDVRIGDTLRLEEPSATYIYEVVATRIVDPDDVEVLRQTPHPTITLVTCYPFYFAGSAPQRFIVTARRSVATTDEALVLATQGQ